ncbi:hypothetical protein [Flavobacterium terrigena]|uniref:Uncharacterized protein n=1 Tax=Flavobacterium terrigena TaxID=402734 RepID=A0A1H6SEU5_9FLAO|nr:hypothetical protein [Flavobacterium terrigena]SEI62500.1 hypothetical protein SAMN05660918_1192 [Flavobacterium terrigena]
MKSNKWFKTLDYFLNKGYVNNGLTIPFLVGLYTKNEICIRELITSMSETNNISIQKCDRIDEFVFGIFINESNNEIKLYKNISGLIILDNSLGKINSLDELIALFENLYFENIQQELFSKNKGIWGSYNEEEIKKLTELI